MGLDKQQLRQEYAQRWSGLWPDSGEPDRPPLFPGAGRAAERLRRLQPYQLARTLAVGPEPCLLQARINALNDNKTLLAATPGLKQGLVRLTPEQVHLPERSKALRGWSLAKAGQLLRLPGARLGKAEMLLGAVMAVDRQGCLLGDGRGLLDLFWALLMRLGVITPKTPVAVLVAEEQVVEDLPVDPWDLRADLIVTPTAIIRTGGAERPRPSLDGLPPSLANLPVVQAVKSG